MWFAGVLFALFYVIYLIIVVPTAALAAAAVYGVGVPVRYFIALGRVLAVRPSGLPAPRRQPRLPANADPAVLQYFYGPATADADQAKAPEIVLPFFGATGAGKTRLLFSIVTQLQVWTREGQLTAGFADSVTTRELDAAEHILRSGSATAKTPVQLPRAHVIRVSSGKGTRILHLFDAAGERFYHSDRTQELGYLGKARTFILVIDPLSVEAFWARLPPGRRSELGPARSTAPSPELAYQQTHQEIEAMGVPLRKARLAVVFSRADLIGTPAGDPAEWARCELGLGNLIRSAYHSFKETRFFRTAAVMDSAGAMDESVAVLMRWVLAGDDVALPGDGS
jgi:Double-GTPase 2